MARKELIFYKLTTAVLSIALVFTLMQQIGYPKSPEGREYRITRDKTVAPDTTYITKVRSYSRHYILNTGDSLLQGHAVTFPQLLNKM